MWQCTLGCIVFCVFVVLGAFGNTITTGPGRWSGKHEPLFHAGHSQLGWRLTDEPKRRHSFLEAVYNQLAEPMHIGNKAFYDGVANSCFASHCSEILGAGSCDLRSLVKTVRTARHILSDAALQLENKFEDAIGEIRPTSGWHGVSLGWASPKQIAANAIQAGILIFESLESEFVYAGKHTGPDCTFARNFPEAIENISRLALDAAAHLDQYLNLEIAASLNHELQMPSKVQYRSDLGYHRADIIVSLLRGLSSELEGRDVHRQLFVVELGTAYASLTIHILSTVKEAHLITVDPWLPFGKSGFLSEADLNKSLKESEGFRQVARDVKRSLNPFRGRVVVMQTTAQEAAKQLADATLDLVFVDSGYQRDKDVEAWLAKVRPGGIMSGHDLQLTDAYIQKVFSSVPRGGTLNLCPDWLWWFHV